MNKKLLFLFLPVIALFACNKGPGEGGTSTITGKVYRYETNGLGQVLDEYYVADKNVFIMYGNEDNIYDDDFSTSFDGSYEFKGLRPGSYTIFTYTKCDTCAGGETTVQQVVEITEKKSTIVLDDIITYK